MDLLVFLAVLLARLGVPLLVLRFPLPAILAALVLDAVDQTVFQTLTDLDLSGYQGYDKALDVYYLSVAYLATFRWSNPAAVRLAAALWYWRLLGVVLFELVGWRPLLLLFPNTFEYYFIAVTVVRLRWDDASLSTRQVLGLAAGIWVFVKLPQEWWIHIAQLDVTDVVKDLLGAEPDAGWGEAVAGRPLVAAGLAAVLLGLVALGRWAWRRAPAPAHALTVDADEAARLLCRDRPPAASDSWRDGLLEKVVLVFGLLAVFAQVVPGSTASLPELLSGVVVLVVTNAVITQRLRSRGHSWGSVGRAFAGNLAVNALILAALSVLLPSDDRGSSSAATAFFLLLLSLVVAVFDRYQPLRDAVLSLGATRRDRAIA